MLRALKRLLFFSNQAGNRAMEINSLQPKYKPEWQPIETAPLDRFILLYCPEDDSRWLAKWQSNEWYGVDAEHGLTRTGMGPHAVTGWRVTHWMEVPDPPAS